MPVEVRDPVFEHGAGLDLQREVMVGTAVDGMSHEELASALGLSSGAVRGLIYRARATLRVLDSLGDRTQVLFFTHHRHLMELARDTIAADRLGVLTIGV